MHDSKLRSRLKTQLTKFSWELCAGLSKPLGAGLAERDKRRWIDPAHSSLSIRRQCQWLGLARSSFHWRPCAKSAETHVLLRRLDELYLHHPFYGSRRMAVELAITRKCTRRLMGLLGVEALYRKPRLSQPAPGHHIYPYLLRGLSVERPDQVWSTDITYIPMRGGFLYLVAVMDWFSRFVLSCELSNTLATGFCLSALSAAFGLGRPEIFNTDQGAQFTSTEFTTALLDQQIRTSMDGRGRALDNVFIERLWRSLKYELVYPGDFADGHTLWRALEEYFRFYSQRRPHQALGYRTPGWLYQAG